MTAKIHANNLIKFISSCEMGCSINELKTKFKENSFENCQGLCYNLDEVIQFMIKQGAVQIENGNIVFKSCPRSGCKE